MLALISFVLFRVFSKPILITSISVLFFLFKVPCSRFYGHIKIAFLIVLNMSHFLGFPLQVGLSLEDLLRTFVCSEIVDSVECNGCKARNSVQSSGSVRTSFIKRLTLGKVST